MSKLRDHQHVSKKNITDAILKEMWSIPHWGTSGEKMRGCGGGQSFIFRKDIRNPLSWKSHSLRKFPCPSNLITFFISYLAYPNLKIIPTLTLRYACLSDMLKVLVAQLCLTLCSPMDCSPPGSSVHRILQARILEWVATSPSRGSSQPRDRTPVSCIAGKFFTIWATREAHMCWDGGKQIKNH